MLTHRTSVFPTERTYLTTRKCNFKYAPFHKKNFEEKANVRSIRKQNLKKWENVEEL